MTAITLTGLRKAFGSVRVLADLTLEVASGELLTILGPSGCGKTVLLRAIAGLERPDGGTIRFDDQEVTRLPAGERGAGFVSPESVILPYTSASKSWFSLLGRPKPAPASPRGNATARLEAIRDVLGSAASSLGEPGRRPTVQDPPHLSVAHCLVRGARVVLLDNPFAYLDAVQRDESKAKTAEMLRRCGVTAIHATHDRAEASGFGDRVAVMRNGRIDQAGRYDDLYARPANTFVASFLGVSVINLLSGSVTPEGLRLGGAPTGAASANNMAILPLPPEAVPAVAPGVQLIVGIRAETVRLVTGAEGLEARIVDEGRPLSDGRYLLTCTLITPGGDGPEIIAEVQATEGPLPVGTPVRLAIDPRQLQFFDAAGARIEVPGSPKI
jgi:ABC-type sugar transport system ATPase subunit